MADFLCNAGFFILGLIAPFLIGGFLYFVLLAGRIEEYVYTHVAFPYIMHHGRGYWHEENKIACSGDLLARMAIWLVAGVVMEVLVICLVHPLAIKIGLIIGIAFVTFVVTVGQAFFVTQVLCFQSYSPDLKIAYFTTADNSEEVVSFEFDGRFDDDQLREMEEYFHEGEFYLILDGVGGFLYRSLRYDPAFF